MRYHARKEPPITLLRKVAVALWSSYPVESVYCSYITNVSGSSRLRWAWNMRFGRGGAQGQGRHLLQRAGLGPYAVRDGLLITGQSPASSREVARAPAPDDQQFRVFVQIMASMPRGSRDIWTKTLASDAKLAPDGASGAHFVDLIFERRRVRPSTGGGPRRGGAGGGWCAAGGPRGSGGAPFERPSRSAGSTGASPA